MQVVVYAEFPSGGKMNKKNAKILACANHGPQPMATTNTVQSKQGAEKIIKEKH